MRDTYHGKRITENPEFAGIALYDTLKSPRNQAPACPAGESNCSDRDSIGTPSHYPLISTSLLSGVCGDMVYLRIVQSTHADFKTNKFMGNVETCPLRITRLEISKSRVNTLSHNLTPRAISNPRWKDHCILSYTYLPSYRLTLRSGRLHNSVPLDIHRRSVIMSTSRFSSRDTDGTAVICTRLLFELNSRAVSSDEARKPMNKAICICGRLSVSADVVFLPLSTTIPRYLGTKQPFRG